MSKWVQVVGTIVVDTFAESSAEAMFIAQTVVNHLPKITGSERDVEYYLNLIKDYNSSSNCDEFGKFSNLYNCQDFHCFKSQTWVLITLQGSLRDREIQETLKETTKMLNRLSTRLWVRDCIISLHGYDKGYVFDNPDWIKNNESSYWVEKNNLRIDRRYLDKYAKR